MMGKKVKWLYYIITSREWLCIRMFLKLHMIMRALPLWARMRFIFLILLFIRYLSVKHTYKWDCLRHIVKRKRNMLRIKTLPLLALIYQINNYYLFFYKLQNCNGWIHWIRFIVAYERLTIHSSIDLQGQHGNNSNRILIATQGAYVVTSPH